MKRVFVIDENVYIFFHTQRDETGSENTSSLRAVESLIANCHSIALSYELWQSYWQKHNALMAQGHFPFARSLIALLRAGFAISDKNIVVVDPPPLEREAEFDNDDVPLVRVAVATRAILITTDNRLARRLQETGIASEYGIKVIRPEVALNLVGPLTS